MSKRELENEFLIFLSEERILNDLEETAVEYEKIVKTISINERFPPPFRFLLKLDVQKIKFFSGKLYRFLIQEPVTAFDIIKNIVFCSVVLIVSSISLQKSDIQVVPLVVNLPTTNDILNLFLRPSYGLESVMGVLLTKTTIATYVRTSFFKCETIFCANNKWKRYLGNTSTCSICHGLMKEHVPSTDAGEEIICQFLSLKAYHATGRFQALPVVIKDELCVAVDFQIGEQYIITGRLNENIFMAMCIEPYQLQTTCSEISPSISALYSEISESQGNCPWSFVIAISSLIGSFILPTTSFLNLKIGLMLSLATMESNFPVPILAVGADLLNTQILFQEAGMFAERYVNHSANTVLGGTVKTGTNDVISQEAGQLILAARGVCNLGDWSKYRKDQSNYVCQTLESGQISFNKWDHGKTNLTKFVPLKCCIWTYWCNPYKSRNHTPQMKTLVNVFGIPFLAEEKNEVEANKICWKNINATSKNFRSRKNFESICTEDFKKFFKLINSNEVILSDAASQLIRSYFVVSRRDRPHCLPLAAIQTITSLAEAHARLALRDEVLYDDVVAVIYLYEEAMSSLFNEPSKAYPKVPWKENETIYSWMSEQIREFRGWLEDYISF